MAPGQLITLFSAKGGCGKTTVATNLAAVLHAEGRKRVCLVDLDLEFGDVASMLGLRADRSLTDLLDDDGPLAPDRIPALMTPFRPGLDCLLAPAGPGESQRVPVSLIVELLAVLPTLYDYVIVDTPSRFSAHVLAALDVADHQVLLATPERHALKNLRITLDMLDLLTYQRGTRSIVFNRSDARVDPTAADIAALVRSPIAGHLPLRWEVPASINEGVPLAAAMPNHVLSRAVRRLAEALVVADGG